MCAVAAIAGDFKDLLAPDKAKALPLPEARWRRSDGRADVERCLSGCMRVPQYREAGNGPCSLLTGSLQCSIRHQLDPTWDFQNWLFRYWTQAEDIGTPESTREPNHEFADL